MRWIFLLILFVSLIDDIIHCQEKFLLTRKRRAIFKNSKYFSGSMPILYNITKDIDESNLREALKMIENDTCITFKKVDIVPPNSQGFMYHLNSANFAFCGPQTKDKPQVIFLSKKYNANVGRHLRQTALSIGLVNQFNRPDRDKYIKINESNAHWWVYGGFILESKFTKKEIDIMGTSYDFGSITHVDGYEYSKNGFPVMEAIIPQYNNMMGQDYKLSFNDAKLINKAICKNVCKTKINKCRNGGYQDPNQCSKCKCPNGFSGMYCHKIGKSDRKCGKQLLKATSSKGTLSKIGKMSCNYLIESKEKKKIELIIKSVNTTTYRPCFENMGLEIKYDLDKGTTGLCLCGTYSNIKLQSKSSNVLIQYNGEDKKNYFKIYYKQISN
uniref:Metalloendopeptidase n=1 Tax=Parastrongyloides trichosuri TaxID=131310 RepID=A0A0N4Z4F7_PARTI